jgi:glycosyltransferase involved in cell wall biosynthesis
MDTDNFPFISIVTPTLNSEEVISKALESVSSQKGVSFEHIVVDGGSKDGTVSVLKEYCKQYPIKWISEKDDGIASAMNKGFAMAAGDVFAWLDADNRFEPGIFETVGDMFKADNDLDIVYGNIKIVGRNKISDYIPPSNINFHVSLMKTTGGIPPQPGVFFRKRVFIAAGGFDPKYKIAIDADFWMRVLKADPKIKYLNKTFGYLYRGLDARSQSLRGFRAGFKEVYEISDRHGQTVGGKVLLAGKYAMGFVNTLRRIIFLSPNKK